MFSSFSDESDESDEMVTVDYDELLHETDLARLFDINGEEVWLPKSICKLDKDDSTIEMPEWLANKESLL